MFSISTTLSTFSISTTLKRFSIPTAKKAHSPIPKLVCIPPKYSKHKKNTNIKIQMKIKAYQMKIKAYQKLKSVNINHLTTNLNNTLLLTNPHSV